MAFPVVVVIFVLVSVAVVLVLVVGYCTCMLIHLLYMHDDRVVVI